MKPAPTTIAQGEGIGSEIVPVTTDVLQAEGANLAVEEIKFAPAFSPGQEE